MLDPQLTLGEQTAGLPFDPNRAELHVKNNLFKRYRTRVDVGALFFDRYPNSDFADQLPGACYRVAAKGVDSAVKVDGICQVAHLLPARPVSLFSECLDRLKGGGSVEDAWIEHLAGFYVDLRESSSQEPDFAQAWHRSQVAWTVLDWIERNAWLNAADLEVASNLLRSAAVFYDIEPLGRRYPVLLRMSLDDLVRDEGGAIIGLPILQAGTWPLLVGQALSNLVEIFWHCRSSADVGARALRVAASALDLELWTVLSVTLDALLEHGYINVWNYGGGSDNLRVLAPVIALIIRAAATDVA